MSGQRFSMFCRSVILAVGALASVLGTAPPAMAQALKDVQTPDTPLVSFEPAIAAIAGVVLLHERLTITQWTAIGAIILASVGAVAGEPPHVVTERADFAP